MSEKKKKKWIKKAVEDGEGKFSAKAKAAGKSTAEFAAEKYDAAGKLGKEARLAKTLMKMNKPSSKGMQAKMYKGK